MEIADERRRHARIGAGAKVRLAWKSSDGRGWSEVGRLVDISQSGAQVECAHAVERRCFLHIESEGLKVIGMCQVRHCRPEGLRWRVGVEFAGGLKWNGQLPAATTLGGLALRKAAGAGH